ncbi:MAG: PEP/pyruvate-binding domain-containing protein [Catenisphaera adipataccumulans]|jgi:pyruvate,water dikinase|uniref:PEP/pyruvate-binding domain-containing protein n=1 Tax=Catenisphaera adipataccumulans TaxID=700500 RepID=UPI003D90DFDE
MAAFDPICSGIPEMDACLDHIRLGDNVVWQVSDLREFRLFTDAYIRQAVKDRRNIIYFRFASHPPLVDPQPGVKIVPIELTHHFESFTVKIHNIIEQEGWDAFYVFDCLSELQTAWSTDLMMGNFFKVTCPYLFSLNTVAFFPLIRGKHSFRAIAKIRDTTQLFLDVYSDADHVYVRPEKVWNRYSDTMFLPHIFIPERQTFRPILDGVQASRFYTIMNRSQSRAVEQNKDAWDRFFDDAKQDYAAGKNIDEACSEMCKIMMSRDEKMRAMIQSQFTPEDFFDVRDHMIGTGMIGGKAAGLLLARKIIENNDPDLYARLEPHDSYYIGSDVYYSYIVDNNFWDLRIRQRQQQEYFALADDFADRLSSGSFAPEMEQRFVRLLEYYGHDPIIVRSSSILEDGFGNAFAGKYESVFCANAGTMTERLHELEQAFRTVYASTMSLSALDYRKRRGLDQRDEQMALLIQRVSGSHYEEYYMPCAAGVGYSYSPYRFLKNQDPSAGMLRLVMGLGTGAVDRTEGSYPRLVNLDQPEATAYTTVAERHRYSQRKVAAINKTEKCLASVSQRNIENKLPFYLQNQLLEHDTEAERNLRELGMRRQVRFISCHGLVKNRALMTDMKQMLADIQSVYQYPVDTEFTINLAESGEYVINLLQCRPLQVYEDTGKVIIPAPASDETVLLESKGASMGLSRTMDLDTIVAVDAKAYYEMPYAEKSEIAKCIGAINWKYRGQGRKMMLMVPGRVGTSSPELGVPTAFADISEFSAVCEIAVSNVGYNPELSFGSHIFQDLVEAEILYTAVFENDHTLAYHPEALDGCVNHLKEWVGSDQYADIVKVYETKCRLYYDVESEHLLCVLKKTEE